MTTSAWDIDGYDSLDKLGSGGDATVYLVRHHKHKYIRALRVQNAHFFSNDNDAPARYAAFEKQCETLLRIGNGNHSHIVRIMPPQLIKKYAVVEMDYIDGCDAAAFIKQHKGFVPADEVLRLVEHMSSALAFCHYDVYRFSIDANEDQVEMNGANPMDLSEERIAQLVTKYRVVHQDIHSNNIRRKYDGNYILLDFNLAVEGSQIIRKSKLGVGVRKYWPVERFDQAENAEAYPYSDVYSMGILFYEFLTGSLPFEEKDDETQGASLREQHAAVPVPDIFEARKAAFNKLPGNGDKTYCKDYPDWLEKVILKMLEKNRKSRFPDGKALHNAVQAYLQQDRKDRLQEIIHPDTESRLVRLNQEVKRLRQENVDLTRQQEEARREEGKAPVIRGNTGINIAADTRSGGWQLNGRFGIVLTLLLLTAAWGGYLFAEKINRNISAVQPGVTQHIIDREEAERRYHKVKGAIDDGDVPLIDSIRPVVILYPEYGDSLICQLDTVIASTTIPEFRMADQKVRDELLRLKLKSEEK